MLYKERRKLYLKHRARAKYRNISWLFNYVTWWKKWCESGKWDKRGKKRDEYVMSRPEDKGPYAPWNVRICLAGENIREAHFDKNVSEITRMKISRSRLGMKFSETTRKKISLARKGRPTSLGYEHSTEAKEKMSLAKLGNTHWLGRKHKPEAKEKMSLAATRNVSKRNRDEKGCFLPKL